MTATRADATTGPFLRREVEGIEQSDRGAWADNLDVSELAELDRLDPLQAQSVDELPLAGPGPDADEI